MPTENRSERASSGRACDCSGDMYANFPLMMPVADFSLLPMALAMPKSASFTSPLLADQHVLRRHVAVHDAQRLAVALARVDVGEASAQRAHDAEGQRQGQLQLGRLRAAPDLLQAPAVDELQHQEVLVPRLPEIQHLHQVAVVQRRGDVRLVDEHAHEAGSAASAGRMRLSTTGFWKPSSPCCRARKISAMPPWAILLTTWYRVPRAIGPENTLPRGVDIESMLGDR